MKNRECQCKDILERTTGRRLEHIYVHLIGCPEDDYTKEYETYSWWKKLLNRSPKSLYLDHLNSK